MENIEEKKSNIFATINQYLPIAKKVLKFSFIPVILGVLFGIYSYRKEKKLPTYYDATINFMLEDEVTGGSAGGPSAQGSIIAAMSSSGVQSNKAMMVDLTRSCYLIERTLLTKVEIDKKPVLLLNYFIENYGIRDMWKGNSKYQHYIVPDTFSIGKDPEFDYLLRTFCMGIKNDLATKILPSGLLLMTYSTTNEKFAKYFLENHLKTISDFYIDKKTQKSVNIIKVASQKKSQLSGELAGRDYAAAGMKDRGFGIVKQSYHAPEMQMRREQSVLQTQYTESSNALNSAQLDLERQRVYISIVDDIRLPLPSRAPQPGSKALIKGIIGLVVGLILIAGIIFGMDFLKKQRQEYLATLN